MIRQREMDYESLVVNHPTGLAQRWLSFNPADGKFAFSGIIITALALLVYGRGVGLLLLLVTLFGTMRTYNGRQYYIFGQWCFGLVWITLVQRNVIWTAAPSKYWFTALARRSSPLSLDLDILGDPEDEEMEDVGLIHSQTENTDSVVIFGDGSDVASVDLDVQFDRHMVHADIIRRLASRRGVDVGLSYIFRRRPPNVEARKDWDAGNSNPDILVPEALDIPVEEWTDRDHRYAFLLGETGETWQMVADDTADVAMAMVLTVPREESLATAVKGKGLESGRDISRLPIIQLAQSAVDGLERARVDEPRIGTPEDIEGFLRRSWDVATVDEFDLERSEEDPDEVDLTETVRQWPHSEDSSIVVARDHCIIDGTIHGVVRVTGTTANPLPNWIRQMYAVGVPWFSVALVGETLGYRGEYWVLERLIPLRQEFRERVFGGESGPRALDVQENLEQRRDDIYRSRVLQNYVILIAVCATTMEEFEDSMSEVLRYAQTTVGLSASRVKGKVRQVPYLLSATTGVAVKL